MQVYGKETCPKYGTDVYAHACAVLINLKVLTLAEGIATTTLWPDEGCIVDAR